MAFSISLIVVLLFALSAIVLLLAPNKKWLFAMTFTYVFALVWAGNDLFGPGALDRNDGPTYIFAAVLHVWSSTGVLLGFSIRFACFLSGDYDPYKNPLNKQKDTSIN
jgi:hypothetical protein